MALAMLQRRSMKHFVAALLFIGAVPVFSEVPAVASQPAATGSTLQHFDSVDEGVYKGSRPKSDADYQFLQSLHIKYVVDLQAVPFLSHSEQKKAKKYGITVLPGTMNASPFSPTEKHVNKVLAILHDGRYHPVYFHCKLGRDRTGVIAALYKMYFMGMSEPEAMQYLHENGYGFKFGWLRSGLTRYLRNHPTPPVSFPSSVPVQPSAHR
jgi:protein tyrosine/serine phosphatase